MIVRQIEDDQFEVCCIPFFLRDVNLGDIVQTVAKDGWKYILDRVIQDSGRYTFRAWFGNSFYPRDEIAGELRAKGALLEWSSRDLLAIDAADSEQAKLIAGCLATQEDAGRLEYETGRTWTSEWPLIVATTDKAKRANSRRTL